MKCYVLLRKWPSADRVLYGIFLSFCLCSVSWANTVRVANVENKLAPFPLQAEISGKVLDENGVGLPGASVFQKGTTNGVSTDFDGNYSISVESGSVLVFSYIGFVTQEVTVGSSSSIDVQLEVDASSLDEVVVIGYGTQVRAEVTNAITQVEGPILRQTPALSVSNSIAGQIPGVFAVQGSAAPGFDDAEIRVRGSSTFGSAPVLYVIDGVANRDPDNLNRLDPNDIESLTVLKDASAAIYGAQAAGGVILVTTKRGKAGKAEFSYNYDLGFSRPISKPTTANAFQFMDIINSADALDGRGLTFSEEQIEQFRSGARISSDWWDDLIGGQVMEQNRHSLNVRGGSEKTRYFASIGHARQGGLLIGDDKTKLRQYNLRSNLDMNISDNLDLQFDMHARRKFTQAAQAGGADGAIGGALGTFSPLLPPFIGGDTGQPAEGFSQLNPAAKVTGPGYNRFTNDVFNATMSWDWKTPWLMEGFSVQGFAAYDQWYFYNKAFNTTWTYWELDTDGNPIERPSREVEPVGLTQTFSQTNQLTLNARLSYERKFGEDHDLKAFVAYEQSETKRNNFLAGRLGYESFELDELFAGSPDRSNWLTDGTASESARQNYFGRFSYGFKSKYLFQFNFRYDGSDTFPKDKRFGFFPGASAGWRISEESFMPDNLFSDLKLRVSWGILGNDRVGQFQYLQSFGYPVPGAAGYPGNSGGYVIGGEDVTVFVPGVAPNPNITWEKTESLDIGLEGSLFDGKLSFVLDYFRQNTTDILTARNSSIPNTFGIRPPSENIGEFKNQGVDGQISYKYGNADDFQLSLTANATFAKNELVFRDQVPPPEGSEFQSFEGRPGTSVLVYKTIGIYRTQEDLDNNINYAGAGLGNLIFEDLNGDGTINADDRYAFDSQSFPSLQYGFNIMAGYKGLDFSMLLQGQADVRKVITNNFSSGANGNGLAYAAENSYTLDNTSAALPRILRTGTLDSDPFASDFWYRDADFLRIKQLQLGYTFPDQVNRSFGDAIDSLRLYISATNILTIYDAMSEYELGDPEFRSLNGAGFPQLSTLSLGFNVTF
ncbi:MAG: TonB-dependent receptor [Sediminicola sp.]